ncbi:hypothetical protein [Actinoplanes utahensis]|uniref:Uncharacterized protein n=1 Tax=Actinoplanes utahensis TaxID=1869 RepID=A0A0A6UAC6_ACTUT|nr:hypothetical protein [Actinoplanes utahensis]KHD72008.1 hypothetical protein MB27_42600 [Actinoplanes utahensis]GIF31644.1 hypothetical protein Aut01nite_46300 [Actinoplanes utahensis]
MPSQPGDYDRQDLVNDLLAATLHARATITTVLHAAAVSRAAQPQAAADLTDAAAFLARIHDNLLRAAGPGETTGPNRHEPPG